MVRLFVPEGEGQQPFLPRFPDPLAANHRIVDVPRQASIGALGITALLALVGNARPGTFLKAAAILGAANLSVTACQTYGEREVNRAVFKLDNIQPTPGKLWERTKHWTVDDLVIHGSIIGTLAAVNPRALPGVTGWKRFFGAATVGCALGGYVGESLMVRAPSPLRGSVHAAIAQARNLQYLRLKEDAKAQEALSRFGKVALAFYTWPSLGINLNPFARGSASGTSGLGAGVVGGAHAASAHHLPQGTTIRIEFNKGELDGPDIEGGYRAYSDSLADRDESALQDWLERLQDIRKATTSEAQFVWHRLAKKESEFYNMAEDDREKEILRRQLQLMNNMASDFVSRDAILTYHIADVTKRLEQMARNEAGGQVSSLAAQATQDELSADWKEHYSPHLVTEQVRIFWARQKDLLGHVHEIVASHPVAQRNPAQERHFQKIDLQVEELKMNIEATERLLKEFEEQIRRADEYDGN